MSKSTLPSRPVNSASCLFTLCDLTLLLSCQSACSRFSCRHQPVSQNLVAHARCSCLFPPSLHPRLLLRSCTHAASAGQRSLMTAHSRVRVRRRQRQASAVDAALVGTAVVAAVLARHSKRFASSSRDVRRQTREQVMRPLPFSLASRVKDRRQALPSLASVSASCSLSCYPSASVVSARSAFERRCCNSSTGHWL